MKIILKPMIALLILMVFFFSLAFVSKYGPRTIGAILGAKISNEKYSFYGKVIDQYGKPVVNATVFCVTVASYGSGQYKPTTDYEGKFEVIDSSGSYLEIRGIERNGYDTDPRLWGDYKKILENNYVADKNNPLVIKVRKREPPTLVRESRLGTVESDLKDLKYFNIDLADMRINNQIYWYREAHADIVMKFILSTDNKVTFTLEEQDPESGVLEKDELLYVPPETGYKKNFKIEVPKGEEVKKILYVKGRGGKIYSRLDANFSNKRDWPYFVADTRTNLIGERNFEYNMKIYDEYVKKQQK